MAMLRRRAPYANVAVLAGHSTIRTAVMGEAASQRKDATPEELARMKAMVADAMAQRRDRARRLLFAQPFGLWRRADAVDHRADGGARRAGRRDGSARPGRGRDRLGREDAAGTGADGRQVRPAVLPGHRRRDVQRAGARARHPDVRGLRRRASGAATGSTSRSPASRSLRLHDGQRLSVLQPFGVRPDQGLHARAAEAGVPRRLVARRSSARTPRTRGPA